MPSLKLSYDFLPSHLKQCFAYSGLYPKDYKLDPSELIQLWMSQGFINCSSNKKTPEQVGQEYFMELVSGSFFQDIEEDVYGCIERCKMHDLMHDLALMVGGDNCITIDSSHVNGFPKGARHVSIVDVKDFDLRGIEENRRIRSLLRFTNYKWQEISRFDVSRFRNLRALRLCRTNIEVSSDSIGKLKHLRSLNLSWSYKLRALPDSIGELCNMEMLILEGCSKLESLPRGITKLVNFRHLDVSRCLSLTHMPKGIGKLTSLQTLSTFVVREKVNPNAARLNELGGLTGLGKELSIQNMDTLSNEMDPSFSMEKFLLKSLELCWRHGTNYRENDEQLIESFRPHPDLKKLNIERYGGTRFPSWVSQLDKLVEICLNDCSSCTNLLALDQLPSLKRITLYRMRKLKRIELSGSGMSQQFLFPSLEVLFLWSLSEFKGWSWRRVDANRIEGDDIQEEAEEVDDVLIPMFSDKVMADINDCVSFSYMHGQQRLKLGGTVEKALQQLLRNTTESQLAAMPTSSRMTFISRSSISLSALTSLTVNNAEHLPAELFLSLRSLQSLGIKDCPSLKTLPMRMILRHLVMLEELEIFQCREPDLSVKDGDDEECMHIQQLTRHNKLRKVNFMMIEKMEALPWWIQHLNNLEELGIFSCSNLKALPKWFPHLTSVKSLKLSSCGELLRRCERNTGEDWPKISHIPHLDIR